MPLPLPSLDTRRWADLVDEGRALIPRFAPEWTDHNIHDPGITLIELFAWLAEREMYRANRVPERHRRKFLQLIGFGPRPPQAALAVLGMAPAPGTGTVSVPAGLVLHATSSASSAGGASAGGAEALPFVVREAATLIEAELAAVQAFDGARFFDRTRAVREQLPFPPLGTDPRLPTSGGVDRAPALYLGFDRAFPIGQPMRIHLALEGATAAERTQLLEEAHEQAKACVPQPSSSLLPQHHAARIVWEYRAADGWHTLAAEAGEIADDTRALTLSGAVTIRLPALTLATAVGGVTAPLHWVRCRLVAAPYDATPVLVNLVPNAVDVAQRVPVSRPMTIAASAVVTGTVTPGTSQRFAFEVSAAGKIQSLTVLPASADAPALLVLEYVAPSATTEGTLALLAVPALVGTGFPEQHVVLAGAPIADGDARVWTIEEGTWREWRAQTDLDAGRARDRVAALDAADGSLAFGDGERGRVPPSGALVLVTYDATAGVRGNLPAGRAWPIVDTPLNRALLGAPVASLVARLASVTNAAAADGGADVESVDHAAGRAAATLWAHERLVELMASRSGEKGGETLDQVDRDEVLRRAAPERATTLLDIERIALGIPGTRVRRARAWAGVDPTYPCVQVPGTITLVIVPELPRGRPVPSRGLVASVRRYLGRRRVLCTRLVVVGPVYVEVRIRATVRAVAGADADRVRADVAAALAAFLDPLQGGPNGCGWPFGRDVYRSEILALIDGVRGVDHVLSLEMSATDGAPGCGNICVPAIGLTTSGEHHITVESA